MTTWNMMVDDEETDEMPAQGTWYDEETTAMCFSIIQLDSSPCMMRVEQSLRALPPLILVI